MTGESERPAPTPQLSRLQIVLVRAGIVAAATILATVSWTSHWCH